MTVRTNEKRGLILIGLGIVLIAAALTMVGGQKLKNRKIARKSQQTMTKMMTMIPRYGEDDSAASGAGEDPLPVIEIGGTDFVGYLEMPGLTGGQKVRIPVASEQYKGDEYAFVERGSPVKGGFVVGGRDVKGIFAYIDKTVPGDTIWFIDSNGMRYHYQVTGLGNTTEIDEEGHDLILLRGVSRKVQYAVYGTLK